MLITHLCSTLCDPRDCSLPGSSVRGFSRQEYWSGLPCTPPGDLPIPGIELTSLMSPALTGHGKRAWSRASVEVRSPKKGETASLVGSDHKESACNARDTSSVPGSGRSSGERNGSPLQYSCLENLMDREAWQATVHGIADGHN
ncbi:unnamed protein product [Rangifer tarandus platyrhynchus]|uniref:Uncharacterized protein n=1 Tax=Rangifer tarandus platyrhynchus TaxID=3082113 RepID=A0AC60A7E2_RANTA